MKRLSTKKYENNTLFVVLLALMVFGLIVYILNSSCKLSMITEPFLYSVSDIAELNNCTSTSLSDSVPYASGPLSGSCLDNYGPNGLNDTDKLSRCVDTPQPSIGNTGTTYNRDITTSLHAQIHNMYQRINNKAATHCPEEADEVAQASREAQEVGKVIGTPVTVGKGALTGG